MQSKTKFAYIAHAKTKLIMSFKSLNISRLWCGQGNKPKRLTLALAHLQAAILLNDVTF